MGSEEIVRRKILNIQNGMDTCDYSVAFVMRFGYALLILVGKMVYKILIGIYFYFNANNNLLLPIFL